MEALAPIQSAGDLAVRYEEEFFVAGVDMADEADVDPEARWAELIAALHQVEHSGYRYSLALSVCDLANQARRETARYTLLVAHSGLRSSDKA